MKRLCTLLLLCWAVSMQAQSQKNNVPAQAGELEVILGEWTAVNRTIRRDGSGEYDIDDQLFVRVEKTMGGYGHRVDWYTTQGEYTGSTLRVFSSPENAWLSKWFDPKMGAWSDEVKFENHEGGLMLEGKMEDETGKFEVKRIHSFSEDGDTYTYHHYRKYPGMSKWLLIDEFEAKRVK